MLHGLALLALVLALLGGTVARAAEPLDDRALAEVAGSGIGFSLSLSLNAALLDGMSPRPDLVAGFRDGGQTSYLVLHGLGGRMDLHGLTLDLQTRADGGDVAVLGLPLWGAFEQFGVRGLSVQDDPASLLSPANSLGGLWWQGSFAMQGRVLFWGR